MTTTETTTSASTTDDGRAVLRSLVAGYSGKAAPETATKAELLALLRATPDFQRNFARFKDEGLTLDEMMIQTKPNQEVAAWLLNADHAKEYQGVKKGHGAQFRLANGSTRFVDYGGAMPNAPPILTEFVFTGVTLITNHEDQSTDYDFRGPAKPIQKAHGLPPPETNLQKAVEKAWKFNKKKGVVIGESFGHELLVGTITENEGDIAYFPPNEFSDKPRLSFLAFDAAANAIEVQADPVSAATQLGISIDAPAKVWKSKLRGHRIAANGKVEVFRVVSDRAFGREGFLADVASEQGTRIVSANDKNDQNKQALKLTDLYSEQSNPAPCIPAGEKFLYRLESYTGKDGAVVWKGYVRADAERDGEGRPKPPTLNCIVKTGVGRNGPYAINDGAFVTYIGAGENRKPSAFAQGLLALG